MKNYLLKLILLALWLSNHQLINSMAEKLTGNSLKELFQKRAKLATKYGSDAVPSYEEIAKKYISIHPHKSAQEFLALLSKREKATLSEEELKLKLKLVDIFISADVNLLAVHTVSEKAVDALLAAIQSSDPAIVKTILKGLSAKDELQYSINRELDNQTPLYNALKNYRVDWLLNKPRAQQEFKIIKLLLKNGANPTLIKPGGGLTYFEFAYIIADKQQDSINCKNEKLVKLFDKYRKIEMADCSISRNNDPY